jgi:O-acetylhomoserine (thiol)-lyase
MSTCGFTTRLVHADRHRPIEHGALHKPVHTSIPFGYADSRELAQVFQGERAGFTYARNGNPTASALEEKVTTMEDGVASVAFGSGMGAIAGTLFSLLRFGDHVVSSRYLFGNTNSLFNTFAQVGVSVSLVDGTNVASVEGALTDRTRMVFVETIANPTTQVADLALIGELCSRHRLIYIVDNTMTTPYLFLPKRVGASLVINSLTKYIAGHGTALGGAVTDTGLYDWAAYPNLYETYKKGPVHGWGILQIRKKGLRDVGGSLAPEAAHRISIGSETLALRMERTCSNALKLAGYLQMHPKVSRVYYPGLDSHAQHGLASSLFRAAGGLLAFEPADGIDCFDLLNRMKTVVCSSHLGDTRTLVIPVAHTIFHEIGSAGRASMGITDSLIRVSVGIEDIEDLLADFNQGLASQGTGRQQ